MFTKCSNIVLKLFDSQMQHRISLLLDQGVPRLAPLGNFVAGAETSRRPFSFGFGVTFHAILGLLTATISMPTHAAEASPAPDWSVANAVDPDPLARPAVQPLSERASIRTSSAST
jgi:hypothetical protein